MERERLARTGQYYTNVHEWICIVVVYIDIIEGERVITYGSRYNMRSGDVQN